MTEARRVRAAFISRRWCGESEKKAVSDPDTKAEIDNNTTNTASIATSEPTSNGITDIT